MTVLTHVTPSPRGLGAFRELLDAKAYAGLLAAAEDFRRRFDRRVIWNVNTTAAGGGVAEMLQSLVAYTRGVGVDCRWTVIAGNAPFFALTKRLHNNLHGSAGDGGALDEPARVLYERTLMSSGAELRALVRPGDVVILHDPQTAGLLPLLAGGGATLIWRAHIGTDAPNQRAREAWDFLAPYVCGADAYVFSRPGHVWDQLDPRRAWIIPPSIDAFSPKNQTLDRGACDAILRACGLIPELDPAGPPVFRRHDGSDGRVSRQSRMLGAPRLEPQLPIVCQVSRWDRLKDPLGVMRGFVDHVLPRHDAQLLLAGPDVDGVVDDPEGQAVLTEVRRAWADLFPTARRRIALACLPMRDVDENAVIVNALQRRAHVVVQKSLAEGFGLTVSEAMWKARPTVASRVGGIQDQIVDGESGYLLDDPADLPAFGHTVSSLLEDPLSAQRIGEAARERVCRRFLPTRHLMQYAALLSTLDGASAGAAQGRPALAATG